MRFLARSESGLAANLALDEALLLEAERTGTETLRIWDFDRHAVVMGVSGRVEREVNVAECERDAIPIHRRSSGGGTVLIGPGCLMFSLILQYESDARYRDVNGSYRAIFDTLIRAFGPLVGADRLTMRGVCDLVFDGKKCSGNAQQRKQKSFLHHGTILHDFDLAKISHYLHQPERMPEYRADRPHAEFVTNLPMPAAEIVAALRTAWRAGDVAETLPLELMEELTRSKFETREWNFKR